MSAFRPMAASAPGATHFAPNGSSLKLPSMTSFCPSRSAVIHRIDAEPIGAAEGQRREHRRNRLVAPTIQQLDQARASRLRAKVGQRRRGDLRRRATPQLNQSIARLG